MVDGVSVARDRGWIACGGLRWMGYRDRVDMIWMDWIWISFRLGVWIDEDGFGLVF